MPIYTYHFKHSLRLQTLQSRFALQKCGNLAQKPQFKITHLLNNEIVLKIAGLLKNALKIRHIFLNKLDQFKLILLSLNNMTLSKSNQVLLPNQGPLSPAVSNDIFLKTSNLHFKIANKH